MFETTMDIFVFILGMTSTVITSIMNMPLAWKVFRTKNTTSLSVTTLVLSLFACLFWLIYATLMIINGYVITFNDPLLASLPILISNCILTFLISYTLTIKLRNDHRERVKNKNTAVAAK